MFTETELENQALLVEKQELEKRLERVKLANRQLREEVRALQKRDKKLERIIRLMRRGHEQNPE